MDSILKHINEAYGLISSLCVSGDVVDVVAVARSHLRDAGDELKRKAVSACTKNEDGKEDADG